MSFSDFVISDPDTQSLPGPYDDHQFLRPCHPGVDKISLEKHVMEYVDGHNHRGIFASLRFMNPIHPLKGKVKQRLI